MAGGFALCVVLVPGTALAEDEPAPAPPDAVTDVLEGEQGSEQPQDVDEQAVEEESPTEETPEEPPPFEIPPEVVAALQQFADQAGFSEDCVTGVTESLELIGNGVAGLPAELQELVTDLGAAVQESIEAQDPTALEEFLSGLAPAPPEEGSEEPPALPIGGDIAAGLEQLAETLQSDACQPAPPAGAPDANPPQTAGELPATAGPRRPAPGAGPAGAGPAGGLPGLRADRSGGGRGRTVAGRDRDRPGGPRRWRGLDREALACGASLMACAPRPPC